MYLPSLHFKDCKKCPVLDLILLCNWVFSVAQVYKGQVYSKYSSNLLFNLKLGRLPLETAAGIWFLCLTLIACAYTAKTNDNSLLCFLSCRHWFRWKLGLNCQANFQSSQSAHGLGHAAFQWLLIQFGCNSCSNGSFLERRGSQGWPWGTLLKYVKTWSCSQLHGKRLLFILWCQLFHWLHLCS